MFLWIGDITLARAAAIETLNAYRITSHRSLITAAKIIAFELAALGSLSQSMAEDISIPLALRLRANANSMDRAADRNRAALENEERAAAVTARTSHLTEEAAAASVAEAQRAVRDAKARARSGQPPVPPSPAVPPTMPPALAAQFRNPTTEQQWQAAWAEAMADVAAEFTADLSKLPPAERAAEMIRIQSLTEAAKALASGSQVSFADIPGLANGQLGRR
jgi:hypothetical protein